LIFTSGVRSNLDLQAEKGVRSMTNVIQFPGGTKPGGDLFDNPVVEIFDGSGEFLVSVNESGIDPAEVDRPYGLICWNGISYDQAWNVARELAEDYSCEIADLTEGL
jgi:hypothetical protein